MSMHYEFDHNSQTVFDLLTDPQFLVDRCLELGELEVSCEVEEQGKSTVISMARKMERDLPEFIAKMLDPVQSIQMTENWQGDANDGFTGDYTFVMEGQPVSITATFELYPTDSGCCYVIDHRAKVKVPLLGSRIEKYIRAQAKEGCVAELDYAKQCLD